MHTQSQTHKQKHKTTTDAHTQKCTCTGTHAQTQMNRRTCNHLPNHLPTCICVWRCVRPVVRPCARSHAWLARSLALVQHFLTGFRNAVPRLTMPIPCGQLLVRMRQKTMKTLSNGSWTQHHGRMDGQLGVYHSCRQPHENRSLPSRGPLTRIDCDRDQRCVRGINELWGFIVQLQERNCSATFADPVQPFGPFLIHPLARAHGLGLASGPGGSVAAGRFRLRSGGVALAAAPGLGRALGAHKCYVFAGNLRNWRCQRGC